MQLWSWMFNSQKLNNDMMLGDKPPPQGSFGFWYVLAISVFFEDWCRIILQLCDHKISYHALPRTLQKSPTCLKQYAWSYIDDVVLCLFIFVKLRHRSRTRCFVEEIWGPFSLKAKLLDQLADWREKKDKACTKLLVDLSGAPCMQQYLHK